MPRWVLALPAAVDSVLTLKRVVGRVKDWQEVRGEPLLQVSRAR